MIALTCSVSFWSISAMMALMVPTTSSETTAVSRKACSASVRTAVSTSLRARSVFGRNSFCSRASSCSVAITGPLLAAWVCASAICFSQLVSDPSGLRFGFVRQRLQQRRIVQYLRDQFLRSGLAIHVSHEIGQLRARLEQLAERVNLARHGCRREVIHALEREVHAQLALPGQRVGYAEGDPGLHGFHALVEVVDVDREELPLVDIR